jgi:hypothetical protein
MFIVFYPVESVYCDLLHILLFLWHTDPWKVFTYVFMYWHLSICPTMPPSLLFPDVEGIGVKYL